MQEPYPYSLFGPPRQVPWPIRGQMLFGGFFNQFGWMWLGFTMLFMWVFGTSISLKGVYFWVSAVDTAQGVVTTVGSTGASENDEPVYANHYSFRVGRLEKVMQGISYTTGHAFSEGDTVTIEYISLKPNVSRIAGARSGTFGPWVLCIG